MPTQALRLIPKRQKHQSPKQLTLKYYAAAVSTANRPSALSEEIPDTQARNLQAPASCIESISGAKTFNDHTCKVNANAFMSATTKGHDLEWMALVLGTLWRETIEGLIPVLGHHMAVLGENINEV
jgi:hypothetical protein